MNEVTKELEATLGPDTNELSMRFGLHSGPVTAGVLRGDRARFQLFGDTVNMASRMESTGIRGRIHISQATANCLVKSGKGNWVKQRQEEVLAKGKGTLTTFWCNVNRGSEEAQSVSASSDSAALVSKSLADKSTVNTRLINWMTELLLDNIKKVIHVRVDGKGQSSGDLFYQPAEGMTCLDEVTAVIDMPRFDQNSASKIGTGSHRNVVVDPETVNSLREFVTAIAALYRKNPFHNFEHGKCSAILGNLNRAACSYCRKLSHSLSDLKNQYSLSRISLDDQASWPHCGPGLDREGRQDCRRYRGSSS